MKVIIFLSLYHLFVWPLIYARISMYVQQSYFLPTMASGRYHCHTLKMCDPIHFLTSHFTPSNWRFWYPWEAHIFLITPVKFYVWSMFNLDMNKIVVNYWESGIPLLKSFSFLWAIFRHTFASNINLVKAMQAKLQNYGFWVTVLHVCWLENISKFWKIGSPTFK